MSMKIASAPRKIRHCLLWSLLVCLAASASATDEAVYDLHYTIALHPKKESAKVTIAIEDARLLKELDFNLNPNHSGIEANGELEVEDGRAVWRPPEENARLTLWSKITHVREEGEYDARITPDWAIFRGDDMVPAAAVRTAPGARARATLTFKLPEGWPSVNTGWPSIEETRFRIANPSRRFDRPTGWMIAGKLGTRRDELGNTKVAVSAPKGSGLRRMDILTFLNFVWPEVEAAFPHTPARLLLVGAGDPMWRGGLSASNSLFLHADRPLVSENGTSPLIHELVHMVTDIHGAENQDWIAEGLTEFYAVELLYRAGGMTEERREKVFEDLAEWGEDVETLIKPQSTGEITARATVLFNKLDQEIRQRSDNAHNIDDLTRELIAEHDVSLEDLRETCEDLLDDACKTLQTSLLIKED